MQNLIKYVVGNTTSIFESIKGLKSVVTLSILLMCFSCAEKKNEQHAHKENNKKEMKAKDILGHPDYQAISYGGYRLRSREHQPTIAELKEDMLLLSALGIKMIRTYNVGFAHASNVLKAIEELSFEDKSFEMYVMLGAWIDCQRAWTDHPNHDAEDEEANMAEINRAVALANRYPNIVKIIAVGNEAMVKWAATYFVQPGVILKYVSRLQDLKKNGELHQDLWITSSDNFASWGGGGEEYHTEELNKLIAAVDYLSVHTYPMHDTHYNPEFWGSQEEEQALLKEEKIELAMKRSLEYAQSQYRSVENYMKQIGEKKPIHIGETGWASASNGLYGPDGSKATDEYKESRYYELMREWTNSAGVSCFYFEAFDEIWKDAENPGGSENHFGLFTVDGKAKFALWDEVDAGVFEGLTRSGNKITKTYNGERAALMSQVILPPALTVVSE